MQLDLDVRMYNFGSPRVGNQFWSLYYDAAVPSSFRVVYDGDLVCGMPYAHILMCVCMRNVRSLARRLTQRSCGRFGRP